MSLLICKDFFFRSAFVSFDFPFHWTICASPKTESNSLHTVQYSRLNFKTLKFPFSQNLHACNLKSKVPDSGHNLRRCIFDTIGLVVPGREDNKSIFSCLWHNSKCSNCAWHCQQESYVGCAVSWIKHLTFAWGGSLVRFVWSKHLDALKRLNYVIFYLNITLTAQ